jgi:hypothetical protein
MLHTTDAKTVNDCMLHEKNNNDTSHTNLNLNATAALSVSSSSSSTAGAQTANPNGKQIKIGNYLLGTTIGKGNSAVVKLATHVITQQKVNTHT